ncbi:MAG: PAS domain-containing sensor histidine kinase [Oscillospiraceae bacterium]|nr:PAS domain-containing sensor histidine kinase [Oscillospiraceae bacterium]
MTKRIFRSIFAVALTVLVATMGLILGAVYTHFTSIQFAQLRVETALASHAVANEGASYFDRLDDTMDCRITWIASDGTVLYDNRGDSDTMVNHLQRQEVKSALTEGYGQSVRYSDTLLEQYMYAAERLPDGTVLRLSMAQSSVLDLTLGMVGSVLSVIAATVLLSYYLARRLSRNVVKPLNELDLDDPLSNTEYEEIAPLLRRLDSQQNQLRAQSAELKQKQKEFTTVTRSLSEGLVLLNSSGTILSINPSASHLLDVTPNCLGADFTVANRNEAIAALVEQALTGKKGEQTVSLPAGQYLAAASPVRFEGSVFGVVLLLFDVTQKHQAELLRREFTANVSHELKTPLHTISGYAELMKSGLVPQQDMPAFSGKIYAAAQRLIRLVEDTLRLSRLDEGDVDMQWSDVDLLAAARTVVQELSASSELFRVSLKLEGCRTVIRGIPQLVSAIVFNLTDNAIKYNRSGGQVFVQITETDTHAVLTVADNGIGIAQGQQERIFERFYRVDKSHSREVGGTGLGLSLVKHAALILKADIRVESTLGQGTTVTVLFPKS